LDVKIITPPDLDYSNHFKILFVDFNWEELEPYSHIFTECNRDIVIYIMNSAANLEWTLHAANQANTILVNCSNINNFEFIKGYILSYQNAIAYGKNNQSIVAKEVFFDIPVWFTKVSQRYNLIVPNY
jgi:hypothetical protein